MSGVACAATPYDSRVTYRFPVSYEEMLQRAVAPPAIRENYGSRVEQFGELWLPSGAGPFPVVLLIHGGCWRNTLPGLEFVRSFAAELAERGRAVWNVEYRRIGDEGGGYPGTFLDVAAAADFLRALAQRQPLDLERVVAVGHSAGGHLALWLAGRARIAAGSPLAASDPLMLRHVFCLGGLGDLKAMHAYAGDVVCGAGTIPLLTGAADRVDDPYSDTSPVNLLPLGVPATMMVGVYDPALPPFFNAAYRDLAASKGDEVTVVVQPDAGHFDVIAPWTPSGEEVATAVVSAST
jgi:acetyl esterase/lipase